MDYFYKHRTDFEVIIVDDGSYPDEKPEIKIGNPKFNCKIIRLKQKNGINPCVPYNVGVRHSTGDVLIFSSPETIHTHSIFEVADFDQLGSQDYWCFSVYCPTDQNLNEMVLAPIKPFEVLLKQISQLKKLGMFDEGFGEAGRDVFNNGLGSWYLHSKYRPTSLNFFTALKRETFYDLSGFDERFRVSTGYDDQEFKDRLLRKIQNVRYFDNNCALHLNHPPVYGRGDPVGNLGLYQRIQSGQEPAYEANDNWGRAEAELVWSSE